MPLADEQKLPLKSTADHQIILAGPGTGKSYTILGYITHLINDLKIDPTSIVIITSTRAVENPGEADPPIRMILTP